MEGGVFGVLDVAVTLGFAFQAVASTKSQLKWRFWCMGVWSERVELIPNVWCGANSAEDVKMSCRHFSWQAVLVVVLWCGGVPQKFSTRVSRPARVSS